MVLYQVANLNSFWTKIALKIKERFNRQLLNMAKFTFAFGFNQI